MRKLKSNYAVIRGNRIELLSEKPRIRPAFDKLIKNVSITIDKNETEVKGDLINFDMCWNGMFVDNPEDYKEDEITLRFNLFKFKKMPYLKRGWFEEKEATPFYLITNKYDILIQNKIILV